MEVSIEIQYFILFSALLLLPKVLLRFHIPTALTALGIGVAINFGLGWFQDDQLVLMLARLGITSLFLFAGMEVELEELKEDADVLVKHLGLIVALIFIVGYGMHLYFDIGFRPAMILSLGLMTPSTGFILNSLKGVDLTMREVRWVRSKAISKELVAILLLFFILQTESWKQFLISTTALVVMILFLPVLFKFFLKKVAPFAPDSEASFLVLIALLCGVITTKLGTYYLVGAFIVGMTAGRFRHFIEHEKSQRMLHSVGFFFSFFVPFYFFKAGQSFTSDMWSMSGLFVGCLFLVIVLPLRLFSIFSSIWMWMRDCWGDRNSIALPLLPTLIFGLVIAQILRDTYHVPSTLISGLIIYTLASSVLPWFFLKKLPPENYDSSLIK
jgi:Kef-type K+ transport system membrane component KefB